MNLLDLATEMGLGPHKTSSSQGGEYHCPCPGCGGNDRFMFWPEKNRYWCRQCNAKGDAIQFCRDYQELSFQAACIKTGTDSGAPAVQQTIRPIEISLIRNPSCLWKDKAQAFIENASQRLLIDKIAIEQLLQRGLSPGIIKENQLGWNPVQVFHRRSDWGLEETDKQNWICLPAGVVIPLFENDSLQKIKIRKTEWQEGDQYGKYYEVPGSSNLLPIFGSPSYHVVIVVEAEFDAMLIEQEAGDLCACVALGGAQKKPDPALHAWLLNRQLILFSLDFDEAGKREYLYWQKTYHNLEPWPMPETKSPGDYFKAGGNIREWIINGIKNYMHEGVIKNL